MFIFNLDFVQFVEKKLKLNCSASWPYIISFYKHKHCSAHKRVGFLALLNNRNLNYFFMYIY